MGVLKSTEELIALIGTARPSHPQVQRFIRDIGVEFKEAARVQNYVVYWTYLKWCHINKEKAMGIKFVMSVFPFPYKWNKGKRYQVTASAFHISDDELQLVNQYKEDHREIQRARKKGSAAWLKQKEVKRKLYNATRRKQRAEAKRKRLHGL